MLGRISTPQYSFQHQMDEKEMGKTTEQSNGIKSNGIFSVYFYDRQK